MEIRVLTAADVPACLRLSADRGWSDSDVRWALLVEVSEVFGIDAPDGGLAGAVVLTRYDTYAAIGMMLVAQRYERRGLGGRLMRHAIAAADGVVALTATEFGRPLYERLGFVGHGTSVTYTGELPTAPATTRPTDHVTDLLAYDRAVFGADRARLLTSLPAGARIRTAPAGYGVAWQNGGTTVLGPIVADDLGTATALATDLAADTTTPVRLDVTSAQPAFAAWAAARLTRRESTTVMSYGGAVPGDATRLYTPFSVATG
ncbi:GNAT family N-acetyltransferase [Actinocatenispora rupis]|uniref:Acetyltransferase n=1 Tax=Actinocatenispora rupis TaxID=519421 RepID=A0A8J3JDG0_9ACTN|nr:GNAT family N-acetyltransferase [Actinocatenispora rupis]GID14442.1 acetyltransferase [Actinocatenispora rupis]